VNTGFVGGARRLAKGIRTQNVGLAALGAALTALAFIKATATPKSQLVHVAKLKKGQELRVVVSRPPVS
jgi:hypothetical protein